MKDLLLTLVLLSLVACVNEVDGVVNDTSDGDDIVYVLEAGTYTGILLDVPIRYTVRCFGLWNLMVLTDTYGQFDLMSSLLSEEDTADLDKRLTVHGRAVCDGDVL